MMASLQVHQHFLRHSLNTFDEFTFYFRRVAAYLCRACLAVEGQRSVLSNKQIPLTHVLFIPWFSIACQLLRDCLRSALILQHSLDIGGSITGHACP